MAAGDVGRRMALQLPEPLREATVVVLAAVTDDASEEAVSVAVGHWRLGATR